MHTILKKHYIALFIAVIVLAAAIALLWRFGMLMERKGTKVISAKEQLASYEANKKIYADEAIKFKAITARTIELEQYLITEASVPGLLSNIETLAVKNNVNFSITGVQTPGKEGSKKLLIDFSGRGSFTAIETFLNDLTKQTYEVKIVKLSLSQQAVRATATPVVVDEASEGVETSATPAPPQEKFEWQMFVSIEVVSF